MDKKQQETTPKKYRNGAVGALMDEYERAAEELKMLLQTIDQVNFTIIVDPITKDEDCRSVQTIMRHVVRSGYGYANYIRKQFGDPWTAFQLEEDIHSVEIACSELNKMLTYTVETLHNKWNLTFKEVLQNSMKVSWGQTFDFEQLLEHAIVHILRHRRQIERFQLKFPNLHRSK